MRKVEKLHPKTPYDYAIAYARLGWRVLPIWPIRDDGRCSCGHPDCNRPGKHVALPNGVEGASNDLEQVGEWFEENPRYGVAIACGKDSGISGLDIDMKDGKAGDLALNSIRGNEAMPLAPTVTTPTGGLHYYFAYEPSVRTATEPFGPGTAIDTRNDNGYLIAPPSPHAAGGLYKWADDSWRKDLPKWPEWLRKKEAEGKPRKAKEKFDPKNPHAVESIKHALRYIEATDYDRWIKIGFILGRAFQWNETGLGIFLEWSATAGAAFDHRKSTNIYNKDSRKVPRNPLTTASIYEWAQENDAFIPLQREVEREFQIIEDPADLPSAADQLAEIAAHCESIFRRNGELVFLANNNSIYRHTPKTLLLELSRKVAYLAPGKDGRLTPRPIPEHLAALVLERRGEGARSLVGFSPFPIFRANWSLVTDAGYDATTGMFIDCPLAIEPDTSDDAIKTLADLVVDFPFATDVDRSVFFAALFTVGLRHLFDTAPIFGFSAYAAGSGKGLLTDVISMIWHGRRSIKSVWPALEDELSKTLAADLISGELLVVYDNIDRGERVHDPNLCAVLSSPEVRMRILGKSEKALLSTKCTFMATGNDLTFTGDTARRALLCTIDVRDANPDRRTQFRHPDLMQHIRENRPQLLGAAIGCILRWVKGGQPDTGFRRGSFEEWSRIVDGILEINGLVSLKNYGGRGLTSTALDESAEAEEQFLGVLVTTIYTDMEATYTTTELVTRIQQNNELRECFKAVYTQIVFGLSRKKQHTEETGREINITTVGRLFSAIKGRWRNPPLTVPTLRQPSANPPPKGLSKRPLTEKRVETARLQRLYRVQLVANAKTKQRNWIIEGADK